MPHLQIWQSSRCGPYATCDASAECPDACITCHKDGIKIYSMLVYENDIPCTNILRSDPPSGASQNAIQETLAKEVESRQELSKVLPVSS